MVLLKVRLEDNAEELCVQVVKKYLPSRKTPAVLVARASETAQSVELSY